MKKILAALLVSAGLAAPAHADFAIIGGTFQASNTIVGNDFLADLITAGYTGFNSGGNLVALSGGTIAFFKVGSESADFNSLWSTVGTDFEISSETDPAVRTDYGVFPVGVFEFGGSAGFIALNVFLAGLEFRVDVDNTGGSQNALMGSGGFGMFFKPGDLSEVILAFDDDGANPEDNHDDFLVRVAFVPEPATWAFMILGFAGLGFARRRRLARA
jgi:hypothetical protein